MPVVGDGIEFSPSGEKNNLLHLFGWERYELSVFFKSSWWKRRVILFSLWVKTRTELKKFLSGTET